MDRWVFYALFSLSFLAAGLLLFASFNRARRLWHNHKPNDLGFGLLAQGVAGTIGLVGELIYRAGRIPPTWRAVAYMLFLAEILVGALVVLKAEGRHNKRSTDKEGEPDG